MAMARWEGVKGKEWRDLATGKTLSIKAMNSKLSKIFQDGMLKWFGATTNGATKVDIVPVTTEQFYAIDGGDKPKRSDVRVTIFLIPNSQFKKKIKRTESWIF